MSDEALILIGVLWIFIGVFSSNVAFLIQVDDFELCWDDIISLILAQSIAIPLGIFAGPVATVWVFEEFCRKYKIEFYRKD